MLPITPPGNVENYVNNIAKRQSSCKRRSFHILSYYDKSSITPLYFFYFSNEILIQLMIKIISLSEVFTPDHIIISIPVSASNV